METITVDDLEARFPRPLTPVERKRAGTLLGDAAEEISAAFEEHGISLGERLTSTGFATVYKRTIREMVGAALLVGAQSKKKSASVTVAAISESGTWDDGVASSTGWVNVKLTDEQRRDLGLPVDGKSRGRFPRAPRWPERRL